MEYLSHSRVQTLWTFNASLSWKSSQVMSFRVKYYQEPPTLELVFTVYRPQRFRGKSSHSVLDSNPLLSLSSVASLQFMEVLLKRVLRHTANTLHREIRPFSVLGFTGNLSIYGGHRS